MSLRNHARMGAGFGSLRLIVPVHALTSEFDRGVVALYRKNSAQFMGWQLGVEIPPSCVSVWMRHL